MNEEKKFLTIKQFEEVLCVNSDKTVHTFRDGGIALVGADWSKATLIREAKKYKNTIEITGPSAQGMEHGVVFRDDMGHVFCKTDKKKLEKYI